MLSTLTLTLTLILTRNDSLETETVKERAFCCKTLLNLHARHFLIEFSFFELSDRDSEHGTLYWLHANEFVKSLMKKRKRKGEILLVCDRIQTMTWHDVM